jgi:hypothetical protein
VDAQPAVAPLRLAYLAGSAPLCSPRSPPDHLALRGTRHRSRAADLCPSNPKDTDNAALVARSGLTCAAESSVHPCASACGLRAYPGLAAVRVGTGALVAEAAIRESATVAGGQIGRRLPARSWGVLRPRAPVRGCGCLAGDLFGNSVRHSGSGAPGETVTVAVRAGDGMVRVEISDRGGPGVRVQSCWSGCGRQAVAGCSSLRVSRRGRGGGGAAAGR